TAAASCANLSPSPRVRLVRGAPLDPYVGRAGVCAQIVRGQNGPFGSLRNGQTRHSSVRTGMPIARPPAISLTRDDARAHGGRRLGVDTWLVSRVLTVGLRRRTGPFGVNGLAVDVTTSTTRPDPAGWGRVGTAFGLL